MIRVLEAPAAGLKARAQEAKALNLWIGTVLSVALAVVVISLVAIALLDRAKHVGRITQNVEKNQVVESRSEQRFEKRHVEAKDNIQFEVWYDKEAGSEIVCVRGYDTRGATMQPNCWTTGRQLK